MDYNIETLEGLKRKIIVNVSPSDFDKCLAEKLKEQAPKAEVAGFRKGKVPTAILLERFGERLRYDVAIELMQEYYGKLIEKESLNPAGYPQFNPLLEADKPFSFEVFYEVYPEIVLPDFSAVEIEEAQSEIEEAQITSTLEEMLRSQAEYSVVERAAQAGDRLVLDYKGFLDGEPFEGGAEEGAKLEVGSGRMIPDFEKGLIGLEKDKTAKVKVTFPADYQAEHLAGKETEFEMTAREIQAPELPEINEEFLKKVGIESGGEDALRTKIKEQLERELETALKNKRRQDIFKVLEAHCVFDLPEGLIQVEAEKLRERSVSYFNSQQQGAPAIKADNIPLESFMEEAKKRVHIGLILSEVIEKMNAVPTDEEVDARLKEMGKDYGDLDKFIEYYKSEPSRYAHMRNNLTEENAFDSLFAQMKAVAKSVPAEELLRQRAQ